MSSDETNREVQWKQMGVPAILLERQGDEEPTAVELLGDIFDLGGLRSLKKLDEGTLELHFDEGHCTWNVRDERPVRIEGPFGSAPGELAWRATLEGWGPLEEVTEAEEAGAGTRYYFEHGEAHTNADGELMGYAPYYDVDAENEEEAADADDGEE